VPLAFARHQDRFLLVAVLSLTPGFNLFVSPTGQWLGRYVPSVFRGYPFRLARKAGALPIAYAQLLSMGKYIQVFAQLAKAQAQTNQAQMKAKATDIQPILGDDDMISFQ
jgi:hypothetical protein